MKVLITGSNGQVGSCLVKQLEACTNTEILAVDRTELDITSKSNVIKIVDEFRPNIIINAAAYTAVDKAETEIDLSYAINRDGPLYLAQAAQEIDAALLHISTDYVFAGDKEGTYSETDAVNPQSVYGESKLAGEKATLEACSRTIILRTAWVFGEDGNNFVKTMLRLAQKKDELGIVADQFGGPTYAGDIAAALITIAKVINEQGKNFDSSKYGIYHFSGLPHTNWCGFAQLIFDKAVEEGVLKTAPLVKGINTASYPTPVKRPANSKLNTKKISEMFSIQACDWQRALNKLSNYQ